MGTMSAYRPLAEKLIELWPKGMKMNTTSWRSSPIVIVQRLKMAEALYDCSIDEVRAIDTAKRYVKSFGNDTKYMQSLKYFIYKEKIINGKKEYVSNLMELMDNPDDIKENKFDYLI